MKKIAQRVHNMVQRTCFLKSNILTLVFFCMLIPSLLSNQEDGSIGVGVKVMHGWTYRKGDSPACVVPTAQTNDE